MSHKDLENFKIDKYDEMKNVKFESFILIQKNFKIELKNYYNKIYKCLI